MIEIIADLIVFMIYEFDRSDQTPDFNILLKGILPKVREVEL